MKAIDIDKIVSVISRSIKKTCNCWKCNYAREALVIVEAQRPAPSKKCSPKKKLE